LTAATQSEAFDAELDRLVIEVTGAVTLTAGDRTELTITKEWLVFSEPTVEVGHENGVGRVQGNCSWFQIGCTTSVSGTVAADAEIEVTTSAGSVEVSGFANGVDLETSAGSVVADDVTGPARLHSSAGKITGRITDGDVEAETSAGSIELTVLGDFSSLSAITSSGNVDLIVTDEVYDVDADASVGSIDIEVRTDPSASRHVIAESSAGSISVRPAR
jgi:DUF4097 and DUF4098 domain-containing protein YvlB